MGYILTRLLPGCLLIGLAMAVLLVSDLQHRSSSTQDKLPHVAVLQFASRPVLDDTVKGAVECLAAQGFVDGRTLRLKYFNPQNDLPTADSMAKSIVSGDFRLVITASTPMLQTMAACNREGRLTHVFAAVTDPFGAGVGIDRGDPSRRPAHLVGIGTFQPVREVFRLAKRCRPQLAKVGVVWCPAEACSEACTLLARDECSTLGITLLEANVDNSAGVLEAAESLVSRGVEAVWIGGDNVVEMSATSVIKAANTGCIPVFANSPVLCDSGALISLGADYVEVGRAAGDLAGRILKGLDPATVKIDTAVPQQLALNLSALKGLRDNWSIPPEMVKSAAILVDEHGARKSGDKSPPAGVPAAPLARKWKIRLVELVEAPAIEETRKGIMAGLAEAGLAAGRDYELRVSNAQGDMPTLVSLIDAALTDGADMVYTITTPALQAAMQKVTDRPLLFALSVKPSLVGDTGTDTGHRPNVAGIYDRSPFEAMMKLIRECLPEAKTVGTLFAPSEVNSVHFKDEMTKAGEAAGFRIVTRPASSSAEVADAATALVQSGVDVVCQINDNQNDSAFAGIVSAARTARVPLFSFTSGQADKGACVALANDHFDGGRESGLVAARVMRGESPASIPYRGISRTRLTVNMEACRALGLAVPQAVLARADRVIGGDKPTTAAAATPPPVRHPAKKWNIHFLNYAESTFVEDCHRGFFAEMDRLDLVRGRDYDIKVTNAQGDMPTLMSLVDAAMTGGAEMILLTSTPTLQAVAKKVKDIPVVFSVVANPMLAGAGRSFEDHLPNVTGISTMSDYEGMAAVIRECLPGARRVGTLFSPSEDNSVYNTEQMKAALERRGIELVTVAASSSSDVGDAALSLTGRNIDAVCQTLGNVLDAAFAGIVEAARKDRKPLFAFTGAQAIKGGAAVAVARDYEQSGRDMAGLAARIMCGENPANIPITVVSRTLIVVNRENAALCGLAIPPELEKRADKVVDKAGAK